MIADYWWEYYFYNILWSEGNVFYNKTVERNAAYAAKRENKEHWVSILIGNHSYSRIILLFSLYNSVLFLSSQYPFLHYFPSAALRFVHPLTLVFSTPLKITIYSQILFTYHSTENNYNSLRSFFLGASSIAFVTIKTLIEVKRWRAWNTERSIYHSPCYEISIIYVRKFGFGRDFPLRETNWLLGQPRWWMYADATASPIIRNDVLRDWCMSNLILSPLKTVRVIFHSRRNIKHRCIFLWYRLIYSLFISK